MLSEYTCAAKVWESVSPVCWKLNRPLKSSRSRCVPLFIRGARNRFQIMQSQVDEKSFTLVGSHQQYFATISASNPAQAEFTLKPHATSLRLAFEITYDDAEGRSKTRPFGFRLDLVARKSQVARLPNPYYTGIAMQNLDMFYGREKEIELLQEDFVYSEA